MFKSQMPWKWLFFESAGKRDPLTWIGCWHLPLIFLSVSTLPVADRGAEGET